MKKKILIALALIFTLLACEARQPAPADMATAKILPAVPAKVVNQGKLDELTARARKRHGREPTGQDLFNEMMYEAQVAAGVIKELGQPRLIKKGATPEIIIKGEHITYNGKPLVMGASLREWENILGRPSRRDDIKPPALLVWDELGFDVIGDKKNKVTQIQIYINKRPPDPYAGLFTHSADGTPKEPNIDYSPKKAFSGYLELDGFGIDGETKFWEIRKTADLKRNLRCGLRDCSHPGGSMGGNSGALYLTLDSPNENGYVYEFTITR